MSDIKKTAEKVKTCTKCRLHRERKNAVPGEGKEDAEVMLIGEGPGRNEDREGRPFVGRAGDILDKLMQSIGMERNDVYITNIVKCRPPENRDPKQDEINKCTPFLDKQISTIEPDIILPLGNFATSYILQKYGMETRTIGRVHGKIFEVNNLKICPQYHPAAAIYDPSKEDVLKEDFKVLKEM